jgi:hypothetical protein
VAAGGQFLAEFGGNHSGAAVGRIAGDAYAHDWYRKRRP